MAGVCAPKWTALPLDAWGFTWFLDTGTGGANNHRGARHGWRAGDTTRIRSDMGHGGGVDGESQDCGSTVPPGLSGTPE